MRLLLASLLFSFSVSAFAVTSTESAKLIADFYGEFKKGSYIEATKTLQELEKFDNQKAFAHYWQGICYNKLQRFDDAIESFKKADALKANYKDMYYEYGQALYAADKLDPARKAFGKSVINEHKVGVSLYYMGFISQTLEDHKLAINYYKKVDTLPAEEKKEVLQASMYQLGEIYLVQAEKDPNPAKVVKKFVIPQYELARNVDPKSSLAPEINKKIDSLLEKYKIILLKMINGRPTVRPRYYLKLSEEIKYDTNVILEANAVQNKAQYRASPLSKTEAMGRYGFYPNNRYSLFPEGKINYTYHTDRTNASVYKNDTYNIMPAIRNYYEYTLFGGMATHLLDFDYGYGARDVYQRKELSFNSRTYTFMFGEKMNFFKLGETIMRLKKKYFYSYTELSDSDTTTLGLEQTLNFSGGYTLMIVNTNDISLVRNDQLNTNTYTLRFDFITPRIYDWVTPTISFATTYNDPVKQRSARGMEKMYNPGIKLTRGLGKLRINGKYDFTRNISKDKSAYDYTKSVYGLEFEYLF